MTVNDNYFRIKTIIYVISAIVLAAFSVPFFTQGHAIGGIILLIISICYIIARKAKNDPITSVTFNIYVILLRVLFALLFIVAAIFIHNLPTQFIFAILAWMNIVDMTIIVIFKNRYRN